MTVYRTDYAQVWANGWNWIDTHTIIVPPPAAGSYDASPFINSALIALNQNGGGEVQLLEEDYEIFTPIFMQTNTSLIGRLGRPPRIVVKGIWDGVDSPTNALIQGKGTLSDSPIAVTQDKNIGVFTMRVASTATLKAGDHLLAKSPVSAGSPIVRYEILKIETIVNGTDFTTIFPTFLSYTAAASPTVQKLTPLTRVGVYAIDIDGSQVPNLAVGILMRNVIDLEIEAVSGYYMSRALINIDQGSSNIDVYNVTGKGSNNALLFIDSAHDGSAHDIENLHLADGRLHPLGIQRGLIHLRNQPTGWDVYDVDLMHAGIAINIWGAYDCDFSDIQIRDMDSGGTNGAWARMLNASPAEGTGVGGGTGVNILCTTIPLTEHTYDVSFGGVKIVNCRTNTNGFWWYCADVHNLKVADLAILNYTGVNPGSYGAMAFADVFGGLVANLQVQGIARGVVFLNNGFINGSLNTYVYDPTFSDGLLYVAIQWDNSVASGVKIHELRGSNLTAGSEQRMRFGATFPGEPSVTLDDFNWEPSWSGVALIARNPDNAVTFAIGDIVEIYGDTNGNRLIRQAANNGVEFGVVMQNCAAGNDPDTHGYTTILYVRTMDRSTAVRVTDAGSPIAIGDRLKWDAGNPRALIVDNTGMTNFTILARADSYRPTPSSALITVVGV